MKILILGSNDIVYALAKELSEINHAVTVIDIKVDQIKQIDRDLDVRGIIGHPTYPHILEKAECHNTDILISILDNDESNMVACQIAHSLFNVPIKIARIRDHNYLNQRRLYGDQDLPIDVFISPETNLTSQMSSLINYPGAKEIRFFESAALISLYIDEHSPWMNQAISDIEAEIEGRIITLKTDGTWQSLNNKSVIDQPSIVVITCPRTKLSQIIQSSGVESPPLSRVFIGGLGHNGKNLIRHIADTYNVKALDKNIHQCHRTAAEFQNITVLHSPITNKQLLIDEGIDKTDFFCALTDDDSENILSSLMAKKMGCRYVLCLLKENTYSECIEGLVDYSILTKTAIINAILSEIYKGDRIDRIKSMDTGKLIYLKISVDDKFKYLQKALKSIPDTLFKIGILRNESFHFDLDLIIESGDKLIVGVTSMHDIKQIDPFFN